MTNTTTLDLTLTVEENISGQTQTYTIQLTNTTVTVQNIEIKFAGVNRTIDYDAVTKHYGQASR